MVGKMKLFTIKITTSLAAISLLSGCVYESDTIDFQTKVDSIQEETTPFENPKELIEDAIEQTLLSDGSDDAVENFWFQGYIRNEIGKRTNNSMYNGAIITPNDYYVDARSMAMPFRYYRLNDKVFIFNNDQWYRAKNEPLPFSPVKGFDNWYPFLDQATQLEDESILNEPSSVMEIKLNGKEWFENAPYSGFQQLKNELDNLDNIDTLLKDTSVQMKLWIGKENKRIYQYETKIEMPIPEAGTLRQTTFFRFYKFNDPGIDLKSEEEMEALVRKSAEENDE